MNLRYFIKNLTLNPRIFLNEFYTDFKKEISFHNYESKNNLIWICGMPKSGTTLVERILDNLAYIRMDRSVLRVFPKKDLINHNNLKDYISCFPNNKYSYIKTHLKYDKNIVETLIKEKFKIIVTFRDLRDVMISRYFHVLSDKNHWQHDVVKSVSFEEGFIRSLSIITNKYPSPTPPGYTPVTSYYNWIRNWMHVNEKKNIKKIWYEDYIKDPNKFIKEILDFTDFNNFDELEIERKLDLKRKKEKNIPLIKKLKRSGRNVSTFRSGKIQQWKDLFNDRIQREFDNLLPGKIEDILN